MKNLLLLGATSDMAQAIAKKFSEEAWSLTLAALEPELLEPIAEDIRVRSMAPVETREFDATDFPSHHAFYGGLAVKPDVVICAFGYLCDDTRSRSDFEEVRQAVDVNFLGAASILGVVADDFEKRKHGVIAGISSVTGERGRQGGYVYASTKAGLNTYLSGLRNRLAKSGVHVMTVKPGFCRTKMTENVEYPSILSSTPDQVASAVYLGVKKKRNEVYILSIWRWIMLIIRHIPESIFKRIGYTRLRY